MPGVMDIKHLLCHPCDPHPAAAISSSGKTQQPPPAACFPPTYDPIREHHHGWYDSSAIVPHSTPPLSPGLVRSRTSSDVSSVASASPKEWSAYPTTPRDDDMPAHPYFGSGPSMSTGSTASTASTSTTSNSNSHSVPRYRAPSSRRCRSPSAGSMASAPVQTRMAWTPTEDDLLQQGYDEGLSWAMISATYLPHRSRGCCWGRFKTLQSKNLVDPKRQNARLFRRPWKAIHGVSRRH